MDTSREARAGQAARAQSASWTAARFTHRLRRRLAAIPSQLSYNERVLYVEVLFQAVSVSGAMAFVSVFLVRLGSPNWLVGLHTSLPALVATLSVLPMGAFVQRQPNLVKVVNWGRLIFRSVIGAFALLPLLPTGIAPYVLVLVRSAVSVPSAALNVAFTTLLGHAAPPERRPRLLSTRMAIQGLAATAVGFLAGQWLDWAPYPLNYQLLFLSAFVAGVGSVLVLSRFRIPDRPVQAGPRARASLKEMRALFTRVPAFRNFSVAAFFFRITMSMPMALYAIYRVRTLGASDSWIGVLMTVERLLGVVAYFALARVLTKSKYRRWLWVTCLGAALYPLTMAFVRTPRMLLFPSVLIGLFGAGMNIFMTNTLLQVSPEGERATFVAANSFLTNITAFVGPLLGTALADATSIPLALGMAGGLRFVSALVFWRLGVGREK